MNVIQYIEHPTKCKNSFSPSNNPVLPMTWQFYTKEEKVCVYFSLIVIFKMVSECVPSAISDLCGLLHSDNPVTTWKTMAVFLTTELEI